MAEGGHMNDPKDRADPDKAIEFSDPAFRQVFAEQWSEPEPGTWRA